MKVDVAAVVVEGASKARVRLEAVVVAGESAAEARGKEALVESASEGRVKVKVPAVVGEGALKAMWILRWWWRRAHWRRCDGGDGMMVAAVDGVAESNVMVKLVMAAVRVEVWSRREEGGGGNVGRR